MKTFKTIATVLCASALMLTFTQCNQVSQQAPVETQTVCCDTTPTIKMAIFSLSVP